MKKWTVLLTLEVDDSWVADGFDMSERIEDIQEKVQSMLPYAYGHEFEVKATIKSAPSKKAIRALMGYTD